MQSQHTTIRTVYPIGLSRPIGVLRLIGVVRPHHWHFLAIAQRTAMLPSRDRGKNSHCRSKIEETAEF